VACFLHSVKQHHIPVFLGQDLSRKRSEASCRAATFCTLSSNSYWQHNWVGSVQSSVIRQQNFELYCVEHYFEWKIFPLLLGIGPLSHAFGASL
jgi:hypothetical protein